MTDNSQFPTFERLQDEAFEVPVTWNGKIVKGGHPHGGEHYEAYLDELTPNQRIALILGALVGQVYNGGFDQWIGNGYVIDNKRAIRYLKNIGTPTALRVAEMVEEAAGWAKEEEEYGRSRGSDQDTSLMEDALNKLDKEFYLKTVGKQLEHEIEAFLIAREPGIFAKSR